LVFDISIAIHPIGIALGSSFRDSVENILLKSVSNRVLEVRGVSEAIEKTYELELIHELKRLEYSLSLFVRELDCAWVRFDPIICLRFLHDFLSCNSFIS